MQVPPRDPLYTNIREKFGAAYLVLSGAATVPVIVARR